LEAEVEYQEMTKDRIYCTMKLYSLARKISNGSANVVVEDMLGSMLESMYSMMMIRGDEYETLPKYLEATEHRFQVAKECNLDMTNEGLRDAFMNELHGRGQDKSLVYKQLLGWKDVLDDGLGAEDISARKKALTNTLRARIYMHRAGSNYE